MIEYHKIQKNVGREIQKSQRGRRGVGNNQKCYLYNNVAASRHNTKDQSRIILALTDNISYSSF